MSELSELLGDEPPSGVAALDAADQARLVALVRNAQDRQARELEVAFAATVRYVPFPVRGLARKMLFG